MTTLYNQSSEKFKRQALRNNMPTAERIIWDWLRCKQVEGCKFRRQYSIDVFVIDFYAPELKLAIEIDGDSHFQEGVPEYDHERQLFLESKGAKFLRFTNQEIYKNLDGVLERIREVVCLMRDDPTLALPLLRGGDKKEIRSSPLVRGN
jgi:very-short-patch-repair endonuclease